METNLHKAVRPHGGHFMKNRIAEVGLGIALFVIGALLIYDAFDARGKKLPWLANAIAPW
jgi:hypothetical protein